MEATIKAGATGALTTLPTFQPAERSALGVVWLSQGQTAAGDQQLVILHNALHAGRNDLLAATAGFLAGTRALVTAGQAASTIFAVAHRGIGRLVAFHLAKLGRAILSVETN
jgi:hypothetical protein